MRQAAQIRRRPRPAPAANVAAQTSAFIDQSPRCRRYSTISIFHGSVRTGHRHRQRVAEPGTQQPGGLRAPGVLAGPVRDVDQADVAGAAMFVGGMVAQVGGQVGLHAGRPGRRQQRIAGTAAHRDPGDERVRVPGGPHSPAGLRQNRTHPGDEVGEPQRLGQRADPADADTVGTTGGRIQHRVDRQPEHLGERIGDPGAGRVGVGVGGEQRCTGTDQPVDQRTLGGAGRDGVHPAQQQRMVGQQQSARARRCRPPPRWRPPRRSPRRSDSSGSPHTSPTESQSWARRGRVGLVEDAR